MLSSPSGPWWKGLNRYHWFVLIVAALGWLFDCLDQQLFNLARKPALDELIGGPDVAAGVVTASGYYVTGIFLLGWGTGGLVFGALGDRIGRAKVMIWTILIYSLCTGLSALSQSYWDFALYRFLTGLGVGGEFAVGVALVAEVMPDRSRAGALGLLQGLSALGNVAAAIIGLSLSQLEESGAIGSAWRWMFVVGTLPALLAVVIRMRLKEPQRWLEARARQRSGDLRFGSYASLFADPRWRRNALVGLGLASAGIIGLWGIGVFSTDLIRAVLSNTLEGQGLSDAEFKGKLTFWTSANLFMFNAGAFLGILAFSRITRSIGRRRAFAIAFVLALVSTLVVFRYLSSAHQIFWLVPIMGFCQLSLFGGYAIYFPELFPTRLRSTGTAFCYNAGRFVAAAGAFVQGAYAASLAQNTVDTLRHVGMAASAIFLLGLLVLPFAPETKDQPLPEDL